MLATVVSPVLRRMLYIFMYEMMLIKSKNFVRYQYQTLWMLATVVSPVLRRMLYIFMYEMMLIKSKKLSKVKVTASARRKV